MDHPLRHDDRKDLRQRVIQLFSSGYSVKRSSNIIFVCGGKKEEHLRMRFREYCTTNLDGFEIFFPEFAMESLFSTPSAEPFDLANFEKLVGDLCHAIVIFPEAAGSYAETGFFSAISNLAKKSILVLDTSRQREDSFISLGPAKIINQKSDFHPLIQMDYGSPDFSIVADRINRIKTKSYKKELDIRVFKNLSSYELFSIIHALVCLLSIATIGDIIFFSRSLSNNRASPSKIIKLTSILVGAGFLRNVSEYGHLAPDNSKNPLLEIKSGSRKLEAEIRLSLATIYQQVGSEFLDILRSSKC